MIQLSGVDLWHLVEDLKKTLLDSKVDQIYQYSHHSILLRLHKSGLGKKEVMIQTPQGLFATQKKPSDSRALSFCSYVRKVLKGMYLTDIGLFGFSRVVYFTFSFKDKEYTLFAEFYDKGNVILCQKQEDGSFIIDLPSQVQKWSSRFIAKGQPYTEEKTNFPFEISEEEYALLQKEAIESELTPSKFIATKFKLGGFYAKYVLHMLQLTDADSVEKIAYSELIIALKSLFDKENKDYSPRVYLTNAEDIQSATRFSMFDVHNGKAHIVADTLSELLDAYYVQEENAEFEDAKTKAFDKRVAKLQNILKSQKKTKVKFEKQAVAAKETAEYLQSHAYEVDQIVKKYVNGEKDPRIISEQKKEKVIEVEINAK